MKHNKILLFILLLAFVILPINSSAKQELMVQQPTIRIDTSLFNQTQVSLNTQIYDMSTEVINSTHINSCYSDKKSELFKSFVSNITPLVPIALTLNEYGTAKDSRYTWSSAIYSKLLSSTEFDFNIASVQEVNADTYAVLGLERYMLCGNNCTAGSTTHVHIGGGINDNDSLGPLQIRRHYIEQAGGSLQYPCGESSEDLISWRDNLEYFFHNQCDTFSSINSWASNYRMSNTYELVAIISTIHNTGSGFIKVSSRNANGGSLWVNAGSVVDYCKILSTKDNVKILKDYVDDWYLSNVLPKPQGSYAMAGEVSSRGTLDRLLSTMKVDKLVYANGWNHKQYYPLRAILNYMSLEKLYGIDDEE